MDQEGAVPGDIQVASDFCISTNLVQKEGVSLSYISFGRRGYSVSNGKEGSNSGIKELPALQNWKYGKTLDVIIYEFCSEFFNLSSLIITN